MFDLTDFFPQKKRALAKPVRAKTINLMNPCGSCVECQQICWKKIGRGQGCFPCAEARQKCSLLHMPGLLGMSPNMADVLAGLARIAEVLERTAEGVERTAETLERFLI
jgi:hypothetical protein